MNELTAAVRELTEAVKALKKKDPPAPSNWSR
jgi:hypothetical protein